MIVVLCELACEEQVLLLDGGSALRGGVEQILDVVPTGNDGTGPAEVARRGCELDDLEPIVDVPAVLDQLLRGQFDAVAVAIGPAPCRKSRHRVEEDKAIAVGDELARAEHHHQLRVHLHLLRQQDEEPRTIQLALGNRVD